MTRYDTTGPVTLNETTSLVGFLALLATVATATWLGLELREIANHPAPLPIPVAAAVTATAPAAQPAPRRPDDLAEGINRLADGTAIVKAGDTLVQIVQSERSVWSSRMPPRDNPDLAERWRFASIANSIARDPNFAERFDAANVAGKLRTLYLRPPRLTPTQVNALRDLYLAAQDARTPDERTRADQTLHDAVAGMAITPEDQQSFDNAIDAARALLSPYQLELIRTGGKKSRQTVRPPRCQRGPPHHRPRLRRQVAPAPHRKGPDNVWHDVCFTVLSSARKSKPGNGPRNSRRLPS